MEYVRLGRHIRAQRRWLGVTQEELAEKADISVSFLSNIERGNRKASLETVKKLCDALGMSLDSAFNNAHASTLDAVPQISYADRLGIAREVLELAQMLIDQRLNGSD